MSMEKENKIKRDSSKKISRRSAIKVAGGAVVGLSGTAQISGARRGARYVGVAYDPVTHEIYGPASGRFAHVRDELNGVLKIGDLRIPLARNHPRHENSRGGVRQVQFEQRDEVARGLPHRKVKVITHDDSSVTGVVRTPNFERVAFSLVQQSDGSRSGVRQTVEDVGPIREEQTVGSAQGGRRIGDRNSDEEYSIASHCDADNCDGSDYAQLYYIRTTKWTGHTDGSHKFCFYTTADAENDAHDHNEVPSGGWNRWNVQGFYEDTPDEDEDQYDDCTSSSSCHMLVPSGMRYYVDVAYDTGWENTNAYVDQLRPNDDHDDGDEFNFGITIGWSFGPVSAGWSTAQNNSAYSPEDHEPHRYVEWDYPMDYFPTEQDNCRGVYFDVHGGGEYREERFKIEASFSWVINEYNHYDRSGTTVYSETDKQTHYPTFDVVR